MKTEPYSHEGMKGSILDATNSTDRSEESLFQMNFFKNWNQRKVYFRWTSLKIGTRTYKLYLHGGTLVNDFIHLSFAFNTPLKSYNWKIQKPAKCNVEQRLYWIKSHQFQAPLTPGSSFLWLHILPYELPPLSLANGQTHWYQSQKLYQLNQTLAYLFT